MSYSIRPASGTAGLLLVCALTQEGRCKDFPLVPRGENENELVLWISKSHGDDARFIPVAQAYFEEIERDVQRWMPAAEIRLCFD